MTFALINRGPRPIVRLESYEFSRLRERARSFGWDGNEPLIFFDSDETELGGVYPAPRKAA